MISTCISWTLRSVLATAYLERWNRPDNNGRIVISVSAGDDSDAMLLSGAAQEFNSLSQTIQLSDNIKDGMNGDIAIRFIPGEGMGDIVLNTSDSLTNHESGSTGVRSQRSPRESSISMGPSGGISVTTR